MIGDAEYPVYPLDQLRDAQTEHDPDACIYFLWHGPRLVYVGYSRYLGMRLRQHELARKFRFNAATWLEAEDNTAFLEHVERAYVLAYRPRYNQLAGGNITSKGREWIRQ